MAEENEIWMSPGWLKQIGIILDSYEKWLGQPLIPGLPSNLLERARAAFEAPKVIVSHDTSADPLLNYGNRMALQLWETTPEILIGMPSRKTAEPVHRDERARMLAQTGDRGYSADYQGIRISTSGRRFHIRQAIIWNLVDAEGQPAGQAASFDSWEYV